MGKKAKARSGARLAAVQALYQMDLAATPLNEVLDDFSQARISDSGDEFLKIDIKFFRDLLSGIVAGQKQIDPPIHGVLREGWPLTRIDSTLRAILRAGAYELMFRKDIPFRIVISEYMDIAHAFFEDGEPGMVNGVLDRLAKDARGEEADGG